jgi:hypothetical protein
MTPTAADRQKARDAVNLLAADLLYEQKVALFDAIATALAEARMEGMREIAAIDPNDIMTPNQRRIVIRQRIAELGG